MRKKKIETEPTGEKKYFGFMDIKVTSVLCSAKKYLCV